MGTHCFDCLLKMLSGEALCKVFQIFPPKDLVYIGEHFCSHLLIEFHLIN